ncbi:MAG: hypothetical protein U1E08_01565 [Coriobacteriia bacterium]|nr:hypothetical protein [Actinomycetota bacterium]MDZ4166368.1 hypothetical protein [Coriobacteriia bacterium]
MIFSCVFACGLALSPLAAEAVSRLLFLVTAIVMLSRDPRAA